MEKFTEQPTSVNPKKLITQAAYAKQKGVSRQRVGVLVKNQQVQTVSVIGGVLIVLE